MDTIFILLFLVSSLAIFVFAILALINMKKDKVKAKKRLKGTMASIFLSLITLTGFITTADKVEPADEAAPAPATKTEVAGEVDAADVSETEYFTNNIDQVVDPQLKSLDVIWNEKWIGTLTGVSDGSVDQYAAYDNVKSLQSELLVIRGTINDIDASGLSDDNKELFETFQKKFSSMILWRDGAAKIAQEMFDTGNAPPSVIDKIKEEVALSDIDMMQAAAAYTQLKSNLGLIEETK